MPRTAIPGETFCFTTRAEADIHRARLLDARKLTGASCAISVVYADQGRYWVRVTYR